MALAMTKCCLHSASLRPIQGAQTEVPIKLKSIIPWRNLFKRISNTDQLKRVAVLASFAVLLVASLAPVAAQNSGDAAGVPAGSGLPIPRFVSLKSDRVNMRNGPGTDYPTGWVYRRAGLPLEIIKEFEGWRQVRDADGAEGWVLQAFLSGRRTALVLPWELKASNAPPIVPVYASDSASAHIVANVEAGVIANLSSCDGRWCRVSIEQYKGYVEQKKLWGVYDGETIK